MCSNNGTDMLVSTRQGTVYVVDSMDYKLKFACTDVVNSRGLKLEASFTPDAKYVISGIPSC